MIYLVDSFLDAMLKNVGGEPRIINDSLPRIFQLLITKLSMNLISFSLHTFLVIPNNKFCTIHIPSLFSNLKCLLKASGDFLQFQMSYYFSYEQPFQDLRSTTANILMI